MRELTSPFSMATRMAVPGRRRTSLNHTETSSMDPAYASGFGDLTVHEVAIDPNDPSLMYLSYYSGELRALQIQCSNPADTTTCELVEVDDPKVQGDETLILASDRDSGLYIFADP